MMDRLIRLVFAIVIGTTLIGAPAMQAAIAMPCDTTSIPCKEKLPRCGDMLGCGFSASLYVRTAMTADRQIWTQAAYWPVADLPPMAWRRLSGSSSEPRSIIVTRRVIA